MKNLLPPLPPKLAEHFQATDDRTRARIIAHARKRFLREGFARVTIEDLCRDLRMSKKSFYNHFEDKEDLVYAIVAENFKIVAPIMQKIHAGKSSPPERIVEFIDMLFNRLFPNMSVALLADIQALIPELWEAIAAFRRVNLGIINGILEEGQRTGHFRRDLDVLTFGKVVDLIMDRVADPAILYEHGLQIDQVAGILIKLFQAGLRVETRKGGRS